MVNGLALSTAELLGVGGPGVFVLNGRRREPAAASWRKAEAVYHRCRGAALEELARPTEYALELEAWLEGDALQGSVSATGPAREGLRLQLVLAERGVLFPGRSEVVVHRSVARASLTELDSGVPYEPELLLDFEGSLAAVQAANERFLDELQASGAGAVRKLSTAIDPAQVRVVAILRDLSTGEVLQAAEVEPERVDPAAAASAGPAAATGAAEGGR